jgi:hypothetical protein
MNNNSETLNIWADAIHHKDPSAVVVSLDWREGAFTIGPNPNLVDQHIQPTARVVAQKLKSWGINNMSKVNMVGHSMGTFMITEISKALRTEQGFNRDAERLIYLDPPNYFPGYFQFDVNDDESGNDSIYNKDNGYTSHINAPIMRAYLGMRSDGTINTAGSHEFGLFKTAKERILMYTLVPNAGGGKIHVGVHQAWANMITDSPTKDNTKLDPRISLYGAGVSNSSSTNVFNTKEDERTHAIMITNNPQPDAYDHQAITTWDGSKFVQSGKTNQENIYANFPNASISTNQQRSIQVQNFESGDKLSLEKTAYYTVSTYVVSGSTISRTVNDCSNTICTTQVPTHTSITLNGGTGVGNVNQNELNLINSGGTSEYLSYRNS